MNFKNRLLRKIRRKTGLESIEQQTRIASAYARAAATAAIRVIDPKLPRTWEFSGFSQHGEDGVIDYLISKLLTQNMYLFEIGSADGIENCSAWLVLARGYGGVMVEGSSMLSEKCRVFLEDRVWNVTAINLMVNLENIEALMKTCPYMDPDLFIIDIDGIDYHVLKRVLELKYRPKIVVVEYNSAFGPDRPVTVPYQAEFTRWQGHPSGLYYGASVSAWRRLLEPFGYQFITVDSCGCNAFFIQSSAFPESFAAGIQGPAFLENNGDLNGSTKAFKDENGILTIPKRNWVDQFKLISDLPLIEV